MTDTQPAVADQPLPSLPTAHKNIPLVDIVAFKKEGLTHQQIADKLNCSKTNITNRLKEAGFKQKQLKNYKNNRADILAYDQLRYRQAITDDKLKKASAKDLELMRCMAFDKERLERGESTENVSVLMKKVYGIRAERKKTRQLGRDKA